ncbi:MAG: PRC-barrel domain-containing protein, partial [Actinomycetota bacterium]|nr:PRC-barrel domain-containing protein [Actinomycetota bacterium]
MTISNNQISDIMGSTVTGSDGKIGEVGQVFLDDQTDAPEWVTVRTGLFGTKESFVPIAEATLADGGLKVPYSKDLVKDAPRVDVEQGHLSLDEEAELYRHYGLDSGTGTSGVAQSRS